MSNINSVYGLTTPLTDVLQLPIIANRAPTVNDFNYSLGTIWVYPAISTVYVLSSVSNNQGNWQTIATAAGPFANLTVTNDLTVGHDINVTHDVTVGNNLTVTNDATVTNGNFVVDTGNIEATIGNLKIGGDVITLGSVTMGAVGEAILLEGDIELTTTLAGNFVVDGDAASDYHIGAPLTTGTITIGGTGANTGVISIAPGTGAQTVDIATTNTGVKHVVLGNTVAGSYVSLSTGGPQLVFYNGDPNTNVTSPKGSLCLNTAGSGVADRLFINSDGVTAWAAVTTAT